MGVWDFERREKAWASGEFCGKENDYYNFCQYCVPSSSSVAEEGSCPLEALKLSVKLSGCLSEAMRLSWIF